MPTTTSRHTTAADTSAAVDALMATFAPPLRAHAQALRTAILEADPGIAEGVKWKSPSFRTHEYFATVHLREKNGFSVILHLGAKLRGTAGQGLAVPDPAGLLQWLAADRALARFDDLPAFEARRAHFVALIRAWLPHV